MMNSIPKEKALAEALEEKEQRIKELTGKVNTLTKENKTLSAKLKTLSENPKESPTPQSIVTWKDHQATIDAYVNKQEAMAQEIAELKLKNNKLCEERRYWATQQWAKHLFRWLFLKRHWSLAIPQTPPVDLGGLWIVPCRSLHCYLFQCRAEKGDSKTSVCGYEISFHPCDECRAPHPSVS